MCLTVCPPCGPGFIIAQSENECISLSVLPVAPGVIIVQWENESISLSVLPVARVQFPTMVEYFKGRDFSMADRMRCHIHGGVAPWISDWLN